MSTRTVQKNLAGEEDLLYGRGTVAQQRGENSYSIRKIDTIRPVTSIAELNNLDTDQFNKAALYVNDSITFYEYDTGSGLWETRSQAITATTAQLSSLGDLINTQSKHTGKQVFNTDTNKPVWATGDAVGASWVNALGTTEHTPV